MIGDGDVAEVIKDTWLGVLKAGQSPRTILGGTRIIVVGRHRHERPDDRPIVYVLLTSGALGWLYEDQVASLSSTVP